MKRKRILRWTCRDCLDLEYLVECDKDSFEDDLHRRDRTLYMEMEQQAHHAESSSVKTQLLRRWLELRRAQCDREMAPRWPGKLLEEVMHLLRTLLVCCLFISGVSSGMVYFRYSGTLPVNVLPFFMIFVVAQILLVLVILSREFLWRIIRKNVGHTLLFTMTAVLAVRLIRWFGGKGVNHLPAEHRLALSSLAGRWRMLLSLYGSLFFYPFFVVLQQAGVAFNLGLLGCSFLRISMSDIAFGWQSTLQVSAETLHSFVRFVARPWAWIWGEGFGYPTLADIEGSHIVLKEGISSLVTKNLVSWWPFLLLSVAVYGLGSRLLLLIYGQILQQRGERSFVVESAAAERIVRRMLTPVFTSQAAPVVTADSGVCVQEEIGCFSPFLSEDGAVSVLQKMEVLFPDELCAEFGRQGLESQVQAALVQRGYQLLEFHRYQSDYEHDQALLHSLVARYREGDVYGIVVFVEAWMVPLMDFLVNLRFLREGVGLQAPLFVWLLGRIGAGDLFSTSPEDGHVTVWRQKLDSLGDPGLSIVVQSTAVDEASEQDDV